jgi:NDP-sugar pyrophosphorylase family protein
VSAAEALGDVLRSLWRPPEEARLAELLPRDGAALAGFHSRLQAYIRATPRRAAGFVDHAAIVRGEIVDQGPDSVIEAGAIVHESCRLVLGAGSRVRSGAVLRDEVVIGPRCQIGVHCEVTRTVIVGPETYLGHYVFAGDSIVGGHAMLAGNVFIANTKIAASRTVEVRLGSARLDSGRDHLGALVGDRVKFGASTTLCPGCIVLPGLSLPPGVVLHGTIDGARRAALMRRFRRSWAADV